MPLRSALWSVVLLFSLLVLAKFDPRTGFTSLIRFGDHFQTRALPEVQALPVKIYPQTGGYDGQFYAQLSLSPLLLNPNLDQALDSPGYRARRILPSATAALLGGGHPWWTLNAYALLNSACWFVFAWLLWKTVSPDWIGFARWLACVLSLGVLDSVRMSLVDLPALLLTTLALNQWQSSRSAGTTATFALAALTKETSALAALAVCWPRRPSQIIRAGLLIGLSVLPLGLWAVYVSHRFDPAHSSGLGNFTWPVVGMIEQLHLSLSELLSGHLATRHLFTPVAMLGFLLQGYVLWRHRQTDHPWWRIGAAYSVLFLFLGAWVWSGYWAVCRAVLPMTIAFNLLLPAGRSFWLLWAIGNATALHGLWRFL